MKTNIRNLAIGCIAISSTFFACKKEAISPNMSNISNASAVQAKPGTAAMNPNENVESSAIKPKPENSDMVNTKWRISHFIINGKDEGVLYKPYVLAFLQNSEMVGFEGDYAMQKGKWETKVNMKKYIMLAFSHALPYSNLNGTWTVVNEKPGVIVMEGVNGNTTAQITLEK